MKKKKTSLVAKAGIQSLKPVVKTERKTVNKKKKKRGVQCLKRYSFPVEGVSVMAKDRREALKKLKQILKEN